jgi:hypothetical protein
MRRLNPNTHTTFKRGDLREDGYKFWQYNKTKDLDAFGFFKETWLKPDKFGAHYRNSEYRKSVEKPSGRTTHLLNGAAKRAKKKNWPMTIDKKRIQGIIEKGVCELTGLPFILAQDQPTYHNPYAPSLDRIDSGLGYLDSNVRVVLAAVNRSLGAEGEATMLPILKAMVVAIEAK